MNNRQQYNVFLKGILWGTSLFYSSAHVNTSQHLSTDNDKTQYLILERHKMGLETGCGGVWNGYNGKTLLQSKKRIMQK